MSQRLESLWPAPRLTMVVTLHAPPLPGAPGYSGDWSAVQRRVLEDAERYLEHDVDGLLLENFGDVPFFPHTVPPITISCLTALAVQLRRLTDKPLGVNLLRNDAAGALAVARAADAQFIRVNVLCGARVSDQGLLEGRAHELLRLRRDWDAEEIAILADVQVKHSAPLAARPLEEEVVETRERGGADAIIITGPATGVATELEDLQCASRVLDRRLVWVGSGITPARVPDVARYAGGLIVGSYCKQRGCVTEPVDGQRVAELMQVAREVSRDL
jgi:uncharacterized protein